MIAAVWIIRFGYAVVVVSLLMFFEVADLLPVELLPWLHRLWAGAPPGHHAYIRIVPSDPPSILQWSLVLQWALLVAGIAAIAVGRALKAKLRAK